MVVSADGDASKVNHVTAGESIPEWRLVPNDNIGLRNVVLVSSESGQPPTLQAASRTLMETSAASAVILRIFEESGEASLGEAARWADRLRSSDRPMSIRAGSFAGAEREIPITAYG
jgi:hypothetical protein